MKRKLWIGLQILRMAVCADSLLGVVFCVLVTDWEEARKYLLIAIALWPWAAPKDS